MIKFVYGLSDAYKKLPTKDPEALYFLTDTKQIYKGNVLVSDSNVRFVTVAPNADNTEVGYLYVYTDSANKVTLWTRAGDNIIQVGGGEATEIADGIITISKFAEGTVATAISDNPSDEKIVTEKAVADAISGLKTTLESTISGYDVAFVDVTAGAHSDTGTVLTFTSKDGNTKDVTVADLFLKSATYDASTHTLKLTVQGATKPVEVDLSDLVGSSLSDVVVGEDEAFTVELGAGGTLGGFKTGDQVAKNMSVENIVKKLLMKQVPPTYTQPSVSIVNNGGTAAGSYEFGTNIDVKLRATFNKADAGDLTKIQFKKGGAAVGTASSTSPATYVEDAFQLTASTVYSATATYAEGPIKKDNLGEDYPTGHITAGSKTSSNYTLTPFRRTFYGGTVTKPEMSSAYVRGLTQGNAYSKGAVLTFTAPTGCQRVAVAILKSATTAKPKFETTTGMTLDVSGTFTSVEQNVEGANGSASVAYTVWYYEPTSPYAADTAYRVTLQ